MARYPHDVQLIGVRMPSYAEPPAEDPGYRWVPRRRHVEGRALDAQSLIADWSELDEVIATFPDPARGSRCPRTPAATAATGSRLVVLPLRAALVAAGMTNALTDFYTDPASVHRLYRALTDFYAGLIDRIGTELHADGVFTSDDIGMQTGPFFREAIFDEFFAPYYRELAGHAHARGMHFWLHACGNIEPFIPKLIDLGLDVLHPIQKYTMDEGEIARRYGGRICIWSGFDVQRIIPFGTPAEVRAEVRHLMDTFHRPRAACCSRRQRHQRRLPAREPRGALRRSLPLRRRGGEEAGLDPVPAPASATGGDLLLVSPGSGLDAAQLRLVELPVVPSRARSSSGLPRSTMRPSSTTSTVSASRIVESRWAMMKLVRPRMRPIMPSWMCSSVRASTELVASSSTSRAGEASTARAMAISWRWPWLRLAPLSASTVS